MLLMLLNTFFQVFIPPFFSLCPGSLTQRCEVGMLDKTYFVGIAEILSMFVTPAALVLPRRIRSCPCAYSLLEVSARASLRGLLSWSRTKTNTRFQTVATRIFGGTVYRSALCPRDL